MSVNYISPKEIGGQIVPSENGCSGNCCEHFILFGKTRADFIRAGKEGDEEKAFIGDMLRFAGLDEETGWLAYTCSHWDKETRLCTVYEQRPTMCRNFPGLNKCEWEDCTYSVEKDPEYKELQNKRQPNGCVGSCCEAFTLFGDTKEDYIKEGEEGNFKSAFIGDMLVYIEDDDENGWPVYTCKHWITETRKCNVYDIRPQLCRDYPNGKVCSWEGCGYDPTLDPDAYSPVEGG